MKVNGGVWVCSSCDSACKFQLEIDSSAEIVRDGPSEVVEVVEVDTDVSMECMGCFHKITFSEQVEEDIL